MMSYEEAKKKLQEQAAMCGIVYDMGIKDVGGFWYRDGKKLTPEEVAEVKASIPIDEKAILEMMQSE